MLPPSLQRALAARLSNPPRAARPVSGGCIHHAASFEAGGVRYFVKYSPDAHPGMFDAEADGLARLAATGALRVPTPIAWSDRCEEHPAFLLLEFVPLHRHVPASWRALGVGLARLHVERLERCGLERDNYIGTLSQPNEPDPSWPRFFGERRLGEQQRVAERSGALPGSTLRGLERIRARISELVPHATPSLLHGDLWSGNQAAGPHGEPVVFDPAVYAGHSEVDLAFSTLFGGFAPEFYDAYDACLAPEPGRDERRDLYNLYPLLVHANLFGGTYVDELARGVARFA